MKLTKTQLIKLSPCKDWLQFARACKFDFPLIYNTCERGDWLMWMIQETVGLTKPQAVQIAIVCAEHVQDKFEERYPDDNQPRVAIDAAKNWLKNPNKENTVAASFAAAIRAAYTTYAYAANAAYAVAAAADANSDERKWQADQIRRIIPCPFEN